MFFLNSLGSIPFMLFCGFSNFPLLSFFYFPSGFESFVLFFFMGLILCSKLPVFLIHFWLTKAHVSASGSGSMILASLMLKIGSFGLFKFCPLFLGSFFLASKDFILCFSLLSMTLLTFVVNRFFDLKHMVACSSVIHMALIFPLLLYFSSFGVSSSMLMMVGHGLISCFIFFLVTLVYESSLNRSSDSNKSIESLSKSLMLFFFIFFLTNMGFPPLISFLSEFLFLCSFYNFGLLPIFIFCFSLIFSGFVFMFVMLSSLFGKKQLSWEGLPVTGVSLFSVFYSFSLIFSPLLF